MGIGVNASNLSQLKVFSPSSSMNEKTDNCVSTRKEVVQKKTNKMLCQLGKTEGNAFQFGCSLNNAVGVTFS